MKVRFEIEVENAEALDRFPQNTDEIFRGANGKNFLLRDPMMGNLSIITCNRGIDDEHKQADMWCTTLPVNARIINDDTEQEMSDDDKISALSETIINEIREAQKALLEKIESVTGVPSSTGISESTMLEALRIVSKAKED